LNRLPRGELVKVLEILNHADVGNPLGNGSELLTRFNRLWIHYIL
jgi:hypothetical protein